MIEREEKRLNLSVYIKGLKHAEVINIDCDGKELKGGNIKWKSLKKNI